MNATNKPAGFHYTPIPSWPPLSWVARGYRHSATIDVFHGLDVEVSPEWFCEAVWAEPYQSGNFDQTDLVFGSGGRLRAGSVNFVASGSTVDRLQSFQTGDATWVSNSLSCLLAVTGADLHLTYPHYFTDFKSITLGLRRYKGTLATSVGPVEFTYFHNRRWDGERLTVENKPSPVRDFSSFVKYRGFLEGALSGMAENMASPARRRPYEMEGMISSGYDSPAVAALARQCGLREAISFTESRDGDPDSGQAIADFLGIRLTLIARHDWRTAKLSEVPFLAADAKGEDAFIRGAEAQLRGKAVLSGHFGGAVWDKELKSRNGELVRGDQSGLSLTEYRLWAGFIHCPVPFLGSLQSEDICALSNSLEMKPWDVPGDYSKPIARRLVEEAGVPRDAFGTQKKASSVLFFAPDTWLSPQSQADYAEWLAGHAETREKELAPLAHSLGVHGIFDATLLGMAHTLDATAALAPGRLSFVRSAAKRLGKLNPLFRSLFPWAIDRAKARYLSAEPVWRS